MAGIAKKAILGVAATGILAGGAAGGWYWWTEGRFIQSTDNAYVQSDTTVISPKVAGYVREVPVVDNQQIHAGDVLAALDDQDFRARVAEAEAGVEAARGALASNDSRIVLQRSLIGQAAAGVAAAEADLRRAQQDFDRFKSLVRDDFVSRQRFDTADAEQRKAVAALARAQAALAAERDQMGVLESARRELDARLRQVEAALQVARHDLANTVIRAPIDGVVGNRGVQIGQYVRPGAQLMAVVPLPEVYVVANFKETQIARMRVGQPVGLKVDAYPDEVLEGRVASFAPASGSQFSLLPAENATGNFTKIVQRVPVRIAVPRDNPLAGRLRPGLSVVAEVDTRAEGSGPVLAGGIFGAAQAEVSVIPVRQAAAPAGEDQAADAAR